MCNKISAQDFYQMYRNEKIAAPLLGCVISQLLAKKAITITAIVEETDKISPLVWWMI